MPDSEDKQIKAAANNVQNPVDPASAQRQANANQPDSRIRLRTSYGGDPSQIVNAKAFTGGLRFPLDIGKYYITFGFSAYYRPEATSSAQFTPTGSIIALPVPASLTDTFRLNYETKAQGAVGAGSDALTKAAEGVEGGGESFMQAGIKAVSEIGAAMGANKAAGGKGGTAAMQAMGVAANPFLTVVFNGVDFKSYTFKWRFMPQNPQETDMLQQIIVEFKKHALPGTAAQGGVFTVPDVIKATLFPDNYLYQFKPAVIKNIEVNYSPNPNPSFFHSTAAPTTVELSLEFQEIELWTVADITAGGGTNLGQTRINDALNNLRDKIRGR